MTYILITSFQEKKVKDCISFLKRLLARDEEFFWTQSWEPGHSQAASDTE